ncbi:MAG: hypothetical protein OXM01_09265, partial [Gemmatimonadota bacterium]|nr:hypothetical protein [Gemmatimonadota bacterium]
AERQFCMALYPYFAMSRAERDEVIGDFLGADNAQDSRGAVCVGVDLDHGYVPYSVVALTPKPDLFDEL